MTEREPGAMEERLRQEIEWTQRQREVLDLLVTGKTNPEIGVALGISVAGAKWHVSEILSKLGAGSREEAAEYWRRRNGLRPRFGRVFRGLAAVGTKVWVGVGAATAVAGVAGIAAALSLSGDSSPGGGLEPQPRPTPTIVATAAAPSPTAAPLGTPIPKPQPASLTAAPGGPPPPGALGRLAYVSSGDLWVTSLPGGQPRRITSGGRVGVISWSPSGTWLLFNEIAVRGDGSGWRDAPGCTAWSPVADELACALAGQGIVIERADGSGAQSLGTDARASMPTWSPDGTRLAYQIVRRVGDTLPPVFDNALRLVGRDGDGDRLLLRTSDRWPENGEIFFMTWTPDGESILFLSNPILSASILGGGLPMKLIRVLDGTVIDIDGTLLAGDLVDPRPPSGPLALTAGGGRGTWTGKRVGVLDPGTGVLIPLTTGLASAVMPASSPDGRWVAYASAPNVEDVDGGDAARFGMMKRHLWLMDADGTGKRQLTADAGYRDERPLWTADGKRLLFVRMDALGEVASVWVVAAAGGPPQKLADISRPRGSLEAALWFGYYGHVRWDEWFAWWPGS